MTRPVIAIGLDATDPKLLEHWMDLGELPNLARFREQGTFGWVNNVRYYRTETSWITFLTGALPAQTGEWGHVHYDPLRYAAEEQSAYGFIKYPPFYALMPEHRVAVFDPPLARPVDGVNGIQVMGWGTEVNQCLRTSSPGQLMAELIKRHGAHPMFEVSPPESGSADEVVYSYRIPSSYDLPALEALRDRLIAGAGRRTQLMLDLLGREPWDLFLGVFSETHTACHLLWHTSQDHPLHDLLIMDNNTDLMLDVFKAVDTGLGKVLEALPKDADVLLFSIYGIAANNLDLPSMAFLPELLFRWSFPGQQALGGAADDSVRLDYPGHWKDEMWKLRTPEGDARLESPAEQQRRGDPMHWQPSNWYRPLWPGMKAFALPTYSEGLIRINLQGRESRGLIAPEDYQKTCDELCDYLHALKDGRTGKPMVREVVRRKTHPMDSAALGPPADLILLWQEDVPTDVIESPQSGRIGPFPFFRSGGHCSRGFIAARGPDFEAGTRLESMQATDLTATMFHLMGHEIPDYISGRPLLLLL